MNILLCGFQVYDTLTQPFYTHPVLIATGALLNPQHPFPPSPLATTSVFSVTYS